MEERWESIFWWKSELVQEFGERDFRNFEREVVRFSVRLQLESLLFIILYKVKQHILVSSCNTSRQRHTQLHK